MFNQTARYAGPVNGTDKLTSDKPINAIWSDQAEALAHTLDRNSRHAGSGLLLALYRFPRLRGLCLKLCERLENGNLFSATLREILRRYHGVEIGNYSYGSILHPGLLPPGTRVGRYCSVGKELIVRRRNHPARRLTQHPFFYNHMFDFLKEDTISPVRENPLNIGHDVWICDRVTILPGCKRIGNGAVLGAGAVVAHDVDPYTIVGGVPARPIGTRFDPETAKAAEASRWWEASVAQLMSFRHLLLEPASSDIFLKLEKIGQQGEAQASDKSRQ